MTTRPELSGAALDAELDRLAEVYSEYTVEEFVPWADRRDARPAAWGEPSPFYGDMADEYARRAQADQVAASEYDSARAADREAGQ